MNPRINQLVKSLLQKDSLEQCTLPELQQFADRHPFFGAAQLLLTKKMQTESPERYDEQLQKTFSFFHNPLWVEQMLNDAGIAVITAAENEAIKEVPKPVYDAPVSAPETTTTNQFEIPAEPIPVIEEISIEAEPVKEPPSEAISIVQAEGPPVMDAVSATTVSGPVSPLQETKPDPSADLLFEPYHTVDYFASQGIKYKEEEKPKDKFGQQLKSFTEWLKVMRKVPVTEIAKAVQPVFEKKVEEMAEHSLQEKEVVTEAMAAVWEKQGNREKAIEIYSKLSLLEPAKSTYFAAKIEDLKKQD